MGAGASMVAACSVALLVISTILAYFITAMQLGDFQTAQFDYGASVLTFAYNMVTLITWTVPEQYLPLVLNLLFVKTWVVGIVIGIIGMLIP